MDKVEATRRSAGVVMTMSDNGIIGQGNIGEL
jgi:hypothetical protein